MIKIIITKIKITMMMIIIIKNNDDNNHDNDTNNNTNVCVFIDCNIILQKPHTHVRVLVISNTSR